MRRLALFLALLFCTEALPRPTYTGQSRNIRRQAAAAAPLHSPLLVLLNSDGDGAGESEDWCTTYAAQLSGNYFCLRGAGTQVSVATLSAVNTPTTYTGAWCPNERDCTDRSQQNLRGTQYWRTATMASPTGDFSLCVEFSMTSGGGDDHFISRFGTAPDSFFLRYSSGNVDFYVQSATGLTGFSAATINTTPYAQHRMCATYHYVGDGTSVGKIFIDGAQRATSTTLKGPIQVGSTARIGVGAQGGAGAHWGGAMYHAIYTETLISDPNAVIMTTPIALTARLGQVVTTTRASTRTCEKSNATGLTELARDRPCWGGLGLNVESEATNLVLHSRALSNAAWTKSSMTCSSTQVLGVDGKMKGTTCTSTGANGTVLQGITTAAATRATSVYLKRRTGTGNVEVTRDNGATWTNVSGLINGLTYNRVTPANTAGALSSGIANPTVGIRIVTSGDAVDVDHFQDEVGATPTTPISTEGSSVQRVADVVTVPGEATGSTPSFAGDFTRRTSNATAYLVSFFTASNNRWVAYTDGSNISCDYNNGSSNKVTSSVGIAVGESKRVSCGYDGANMQICVDGTCSTQAMAISLPASFTTTRFGYDATDANSARYGDIDDFSICDQAAGCI